MAHRHFLIYKPYKMLSQFVTNDRHQRNKHFLGELFDFPEGLMAVGRLDENSEGLLLLTTDGNLSHSLNASKKIEKEYVAQVDGAVTDAAIEQLRRGVEITVNGEAYTTIKCKSRRLNETPYLRDTTQKIRDDRHGPTSWLSITLKEGKFRQVRKMTSAVGFPTLRLARVRIGNYTIDSLTGKTVRELQDQELRSIIF